jgi:hypothetical protein
LFVPVQFVPVQSAARNLVQQMQARTIASHSLSFNSGNKLDLRRCYRGPFVRCFLSLAPAPRRINCKIILATSDFIACRWPGKISSPSKKVYEKIIFANYVFASEPGAAFIGAIISTQHTTRDTQPGNKIHEVSLRAV